VKNTMAFLMLRSTPSLSLTSPCFCMFLKFDPRFVQDLFVDPFCDPRTQLIPYVP
jgi:hypothetical protein